MYNNHCTDVARKYLHLPHLIKDIFNYKIQITIILLNFSGNINSQSVNLNNNQLLASPHLITSLASPHLVTSLASPQLAAGISCVPGSSQHIIQQTENSGNQYFIKVQQVDIKQDLNIPIS